jgi:hypothetical protein
VHPGFSHLYKWGGNTWDQEGGGQIRTTSHFLILIKEALAGKISLYGRRDAVALRVEAFLPAGIGRDFSSPARAGLVTFPSWEK